MTKVVKLKQSTKVSKDEKKFLLNYGMMKETIKATKKQMELMTPEIAGLFERVKSNLIVLVDMDNDFEGFAQKINRKMKRFDVSRFKEENTEMYEKYLVDSESTEYKVEYKLANKAQLSNTTYTRNLVMQLVQVFYLYELVFNIFNFILFYTCNQKLNLYKFNYNKQQE